jgi:hypothetical protein
MRRLRKAEVFLGAGSLIPKLCLGMLFCKLELALSVANLEIGN